MQKAFEILQKMDVNNIFLNPHRPSFRKVSDGPKKKKPFLRNIPIFIVFSVQMKAKCEV